MRNALSADSDADGLSATTTRGAQVMQLHFNPE